MKKRKRWIIGLTVVFLAACVGMWRWSEQVPYAFMEGSTTVDVVLVSNGTFIEFESPMSVQELIAKADAELIPKGWTKHTISPSVRRLYVCEYSSPRLGDPSIFDHVWFSEHNEVAVVAVDRRTTPTDRIKAWLFNLRYR